MASFYSSVDINAGFEPSEQTNSLVAELLSAPTPTSNVRGGSGLLRQVVGLPNLQEKTGIPNLRQMIFGGKSEPTKEDAIEGRAGPEDFASEDVETGESLDPSIHDTQGRSALEVSLMNVADQENNYFTKVVQQAADGEYDNVTHSKAAKMSDKQLQEAAVGTAYNDMFLFLGNEIAVGLGDTSTMTPQQIAARQADLQRYTVTYNAMMPIMTQRERGSQDRQTAEVEADIAEETRVATLADKREDDATAFRREIFGKGIDLLAKKNFAQFAHGLKEQFAEFGAGISERLKLFQEEIDGRLEEKRHQHTLDRERVAGNRAIRMQERELALRAALEEKRQRATTDRADEANQIEREKIDATKASTAQRAGQAAQEQQDRDTGGIEVIKAKTKAVLDNHPSKILATGPGGFYESLQTGIARNVGVVTEDTQAMDQKTRDLVVGQVRGLMDDIDDPNEVVRKMQGEINSVYSTMFNGIDGLLDEISSKETSMPNQFQSTIDSESGLIVKRAKQGLGDRRFVMEQYVVEAVEEEMSRREILKQMAQAYHLRKMSEQPTQVEGGLLQRSGGGFFAGAGPTAQHALRASTSTVTNPALVKDFEILRKAEGAQSLAELLSLNPETFIQRQQKFIR